MWVRSEIPEINRVIYDQTVEDNTSKDDKIVNDKEFLYNGNGVSVSCKTQYAQGLHIAEVQMDTTKELTNTWMTEKPHVRFFFYLKGHSRVRNGAGDESYDHQIGMLQRNFLDNNGAGGTINIDPNDSIHYVIIKMTHSFYLDLVKDEEWISSDSFHQYILKGLPENRPNETLYMDVNIFRILKEIIGNENLVQHRYHFLRIKLKELLFVLFQNTNYGTSIPEKASIESVSLEKVKSYLFLHLENPPSSTELAKIFMLNERKLKQDFQLQYGTTIYGMVIQMRMQKAKDLLYEQHNVNEIACILGYSSVPHFIKVFKSYFGDTPKQFMLEIQHLTAATPVTKPLHSHIQ